MKVLARLGLAVVVCALVTAAVIADEGWVIERFAIQLDIQPDGSIVAREALDVDFRGLSRHGIFRDIRYLFFVDETSNRRYDIALTGVTASDGRRHQVKESTEGALWRFRIGDPDRTISGKETYRINYRIGHALNGFSDHDELYWNATGYGWLVPMQNVSVVVTAPVGAINRVECFQGPASSTERCRSTFSPDGREATYTATRTLPEGQQMTIVAALRKGAVAEPQPLLVARPRDVTRMFDATFPFLALMVTGFLLTVGGVGALWWRVGRDRRYVSQHYLSQDNTDERLPLFASDPIGVEFEPPDRIRPGQVGLILDESADTLDVTATIVDLAVRGYLKITELPKQGWFGKTDWQLDRLKGPDTGLREYERIVLDGLFDTAHSRTLSDLKNKFYDDLARAKKALYKDALDRRWFHRNPNTVRTVARVVGLLAVIAGFGLTVLLGMNFGAGLVGLPVVAGGVLLTIVSGALPSRTAAGREVMRRTLGFAKYIKTAETRQQEFAERANLFTDYLPYAIVLKCVDKWARAFKDLDMRAATSSWYAGTTAFNPVALTSSLSNFSSSVSSAITSTPGGSGGSGFSGGSSGGGGGGGGGGSW